MVAAEEVAWERGIGDLDLDFDFDLEADLNAHRPPWGVHDGVPAHSAYWPAMPYE